MIAVIIAPVIFFGIAIVTVAVEPTTNIDRNGINAEQQLLWLVSTIL